MTGPLRTFGAAEYRQLFADCQRSVIWALDEASAPWELEPGDPPPSGEDWFFVVNFPRTGSTVAAAILNRHPDVYCGNEHHFMPLLMTVLHSRLLLAPELWFSVRYAKRIPVSAANVRTLMEAWRTCVSQRRIFGDKGEMYHQHFGSACNRVFPGAKYVLTVRHPLDTLSSYINQPWAGYMRAGDAPDFLFQQMRARCYEMLSGNTAWRDHAEVIDFESLDSEAALRSTFTRVFAHLGADPAGFDWAGAWALCRHRQAWGRWRTDSEVLEFMDWLGGRDPDLHELLLGGGRYLDGLSAPASNGHPGTTAAPAGDPAPPLAPQAGARPATISPASSTNASGSERNRS